MGLFDSIGATYLAGRQIKSLYLFKFDWNDGDVAPKNFFLGQGIITTTDAQVWYGSGRLVEVSDIENSIKGEAPKTTFTISGVDDDIFGATITAADAVYNQPCFGYYQYYDADDPGWVPLGVPLLFWTNTMKALTFSTSLSKNVISLETEGPYFKRKRPIHGNLSDIDQQARFAGDKGCDGMPQLVETSITWPYFKT